MISIVSGPEVGKWVCERMEGTWSEKAHAIGLKNGRMIAGVVYESFNGANVTGTVVIDGIVTPEFVRAIFDYPFNVLNASRITGLVKSTNLKAIRLDEHVGFKREAVLRNFYPDADLFIYVMYRHECRWIDVKRTPS